MYKVTVTVMLRDSILDPEGKAAQNSLQNLGMKEIENVRIGKHITLDIDADSSERARKIAEDACTQLLANEVMEDYSINVEADTGDYATS